MKEQWIFGDSLAQPESGFPFTPPELSSAAGSVKEQAHARIVACDQEMQLNYNQNHVAIGNKIYPFLYSEFTPDGGRYTLLINDSDRVSAKPVPPVYELCKSVSHIPLGIWAIIARYAEAPKGGDWMGPLMHFRETIAKGLADLPALELEQEVLVDFTSVMNAMLEFADAAIEQHNFTIERYSSLVAKVNPELLRLQNLAAKLQVDSFSKVLASWCKLLGEEQWKNLYVVISAQWTLSTENVHQLIIANAMSSPELAAKNIFVTSMPLTGLDEARALCGRIVGDRVMAAQTLSSDTKRGRENIYSLSTSRDLISKAAEDVIADMSQLCPHLKG